MHILRSNAAGLEHPAQEHRNTQTRKGTFHIKPRVTSLAIGEPRLCLIRKVSSKGFYFYTFSSLFHYNITVFFPLPIFRQELCIVMKCTDLDTNHKVVIPILFLCNIAVYGLPLPTTCRFHTRPSK